MKIKQQGVVMVVGLIMLLLMTLIGVAAMTTSSMEEKMAGNSREHELAFESAETALRHAEVWLFEQSLEPVATNTGANRVWLLDSMDPDTDNALPWWEERDEAWWQAHGIQFSGTFPGVKTRPYYIIEYKDFILDELNQGSVTGRTFFRITARGTGGSDQARVLLQSTYATRF